MDRRDFPSTVGSSPLLNIISFECILPTDEEVEVGIKTDSKRYSRRLFKYKQDGDGLKRSVQIYHNEEQWFKIVRDKVENFGFDVYFLLDIEKSH